MTHQDWLEQPVDLLCESLYVVMNTLNTAALLATGNADADADDMLAQTEDVHD